jgi:hypothetical protein
MIKQGDKFTNINLIQSVHEVCNYDIIKHINTNQPCNAVLILGNDIITPTRIHPEAYADMSIKKYNDIPSSATNLDKQLRTRGFKTTHKFSYKYNTGGLSNFGIIHDAYKLEWFKTIAILCTPRPGHDNKFYKMIDDAFRLSYYYAQYLWAQNPRACTGIANALRNPSIKNWDQITSAILGIGFQFHPDDIFEHAVHHLNPKLSNKEFNKRHSAQHEFKNIMQEKYNINTGCLVLSPQSRDKLQKIVTGTDTPYYKQIIQQFFKKISEFCK